MEILPIKVLNNEDVQIFGKYNVYLAKLARLGLPVPSGIVVTPHDLELETTLSMHDFGQKVIFAQSLEIVKKELFKLPIPDILIHETKNKENFYVNGVHVTQVKNVWEEIILFWLEEIKYRLWQNGFYKGVTEELTPVVITFIKNPQAAGHSFSKIIPKAEQNVYGKGIITEVAKGTLTPKQYKQLDDLINLADQKLLLPQKYTWVLDTEIKLVGVSAFIPVEELVVEKKVHYKIDEEKVEKILKKTVTKVFIDLSATTVSEYDFEFNGSYFTSENVLDLANKQESVDEILLKVMNYAVSSGEKPVLFKLADIPEHVGGVRGSLRLLHQKSLFDTLCQILTFIREQKGLQNVHIVLPFIRSLEELLELKKELAVKKLGRKHSLQIWMELAVPENIINLEEYVVQGLDGVVLNIDELVSHLLGFDRRLENVNFYQKEVKSLIKFLNGAMQVIHKHQIPLIVTGSLALDHRVLEFLIEKGLFGVVVPRYEAYSVADLLYQVEKKILIKKTYPQVSIRA